MRQLKGFSLRRPGRPRGSRAADRKQTDFFPLEKVLAQCSWSKFWGAREGGGGAADAPPATQKRLYVPVTRKVDDKIVVFARPAPRKVVLKNEQKGEGL